MYPLLNSKITLLSGLLGQCYIYRLAKIAKHENILLLRVQILHPHHKTITRRVKKQQLILLKKLIKQMKFNSKIYRKRINRIKIYSYSTSNPIAIAWTHYRRNKKNQV